CKGRLYPAVVFEKYEREKERAVVMRIRSSDERESGGIRPLGIEREHPDRDEHRAERIGAPVDREQDGGRKNREQRGGRESARHQKRDEGDRGETEGDRADDQQRRIAERMDDEVVQRRPGIEMKGVK